MNRAERVAHNESVFREANEALRGEWERVRLPDTALFICECGDERCTRVIRMTLEEYERVRSDATWFAIVPGHDLDLEDVVTRRAFENGAQDRFAVVEKTDADAARVARERYPR